MPFFEFPHFVTGDRSKIKPVFLNDEQYGLALDCLVKACTDLLVLDGDRPDSKVLLGKRIVEPQPDWWFMGGRMRCGESPEASVVRLVRRELQLDLAGERFRALTTNSYAWAKREQPPKENGTCDISVVFTLVLTPEEVRTIHLDEKEYSDVRWFSIDEIIAGDFHPALRSAARDLKTRQIFDNLKSAVANESDDKSLAYAARHLVASWATRPEL
ncbi:hypothetical protein KFL_002560100 [Klebsormidium nitens]|uniref:Nudix hydrolase domain-containing protein n=1 Tax=Klebsormidium nitens TaxID=105231 RepID=A0A0U9HMS0_KLENI|nr:hypothetical protein KFL_002560100 [Klebsormidium nitens]|eukprot:GAQ85826.1 hypothetical protein KFL_002560100 [Klebsormidium nitens]